MLRKVITRSDTSRFVHSVIALGGEGPVADQLRFDGIGVHVLGISLRTGVSGVLRLRATGRRLDPDVVVGWMYHGNLGASILSLGLRHRPPVVWGIRQTLYDLAREKPGTAAVIRLGAVFSRRGPTKIIYNSSVSAAQHATFGYDSERGIVIPNGFDLARFAPSAAIYEKVRRELALSRESVLIGMVARFHPMKRHQLFVEAIPAVLAAHPNTHFVMIGHGVTSSNRVLRKTAEKLQVQRNLSLIGERTDIDQLIPALDILCVPSAWGEGFPNVVGEAMSCEVPCVVTDVGDSARLVGRSGIVVKPDSAEELARGINALLAEGSHGRRLLGRLGRRRIGECYALSSVAQQFDEIVQGALSE